VPPNGCQAFTTCTGIKETRQRELEATDPTFPQSFRLTGERGRAIGDWEDETIAWQQKRAEQRKLRKRYRPGKVHKLNGPRRLRAGGH
jgi:hypothetical protein